MSGLFSCPAIVAYATAATRPAWSHAGCDPKARVASVGRYFPESCYETVTEEMVTGRTGAPSLPDVVPCAAMPVTTSSPSVTVPNTV